MPHYKLSMNKMVALTVCVLPTTIIFCTVLLSKKVSANCECGYTVGSSLYTELLETDFLHLEAISVDTDWKPQNYEVTAEAARGPYGKNASVSNVISNPVKHSWDWVGGGVGGGDPGLQLWVRGGIPEDGLVSIAEVASTREDMRYGSFRVSMKMTGISGTCGAFFWYLNDTQEIDMEFLSKQFNATSNPVNLVLQSPEAEQAGFNAINTSTYSRYPLAFAPDVDYHEYRFDWSPNAVSFYADGSLLTTMTESVPTLPGHIILSHWSNGDPGWSGGPPVSDAVITVEYFKAYFNSSNAARWRDWSNRCTNLLAPNATCIVPDLTTTPNGNGNSSTYFFSQQPNMTVNQTVFGLPKTNQTIMREKKMIFMFAALFISLRVLNLWLD